MVNEIHQKINLRKIRVCVTRFVYFTFGTIYYFEVDIETFRLVFLSHMVMLVTTNCLNFSIWNPPQIFSYLTKFNQFFPRNCDAHKRNKKIWNVIEKKKKKLSWMWILWWSTTFFFSISLDVFVKRFFLGLVKKKINWCPFSLALPSSNTTCSMYLSFMSLLM